MFAFAHSPIATTRYHDIYGLTWAPLDMTQVMPGTALCRSLRLGHWAQRDSADICNSGVIIAWTDDDWLARV